MIVTFFKSLPANFPFALLVIGSVLMTVADIFAKKWSLWHANFSYGLAFLFYFLGINLFICTLGFKNLAIASAILVTVNTILLVLVSRFYFHERMTLVQTIGIVLAIVSVIMLEWES